jgi:type I restriction-modification system DNA methylase subunit
MARQSKKTETTPTLGFEAKLWVNATALRKNMEVTEHKHAVLGLVFLKCCAASCERDTAV